MFAPISPTKAPVTRDAGGEAPDSLEPSNSRVTTPPPDGLVSVGIPPTAQTDILTPRATFAPCAPSFASLDHPCPMRSELLSLATHLSPPARVNQLSFPAAIGYSMLVATVLACTLCCTRAPSNFPIASPVS
jgi:hypothetical protein